RLLDLGTARRPELSLQLAAETAQRRCREHGLARAADADREVVVRSHHRRAALIDAVTSPSWISLMRAPDARISSIRSWWRGRSSTIAVTSLTMRPKASAIARTLSPTGSDSWMRPRARGPTAILRMYMSGSEGIVPRGAAATIEIAFVPP